MHGIKHGVEEFGLHHLIWQCCQLKPLIPLKVRWGTLGWDTFFELSAYSLQLVWKLPGLGIFGQLRLLAGSLIAKTFRLSVVSCDLNAVG